MKTILSLEKELKVQMQNKINALHIFFFDLEQHYVWKLVNLLYLSYISNYSAVIGKQNWDAEDLFQM